MKETYRKAKYWTGAEPQIGIHVMRRAFPCTRSFLDLGKEEVDLGHRGLLGRDQAEKRDQSPRDTEESDSIKHRHGNRAYSYRINKGRVVSS